MTAQPNFVIASSDITVVLYPDNSDVGLEVIAPAGQKLFISLPGNVMKGLGQQLQEFSDQHPETLSWEPVSVASEGEPEG